MSSDLFEDIDCPLCKIDDSFLKYELKEILKYKNLSMDHEYKVVECKKCGLIYVNPRLKKEIIDEIYAEDLYDSWGTNYEYKPEVNLRYDIFHSNLDDRMYAFKALCDRLDHHNIKGSVLEVGSSFGYLLKMMAERGFDAYGVELSKYTTEFAKEKHGLENLWCGDFLDIDFKGQKFDLIVLWHVFEHIYHPNKTIKKCAELLNPGGTIVLSCPFHDEFLEEKINPVEHLYYFQKKHLQKFMEKTFDCTTWAENAFVFGQKITEEVAEEL